MVICRKASFIIFVIYNNLVSMTIASTYSLVINVGLSIEVSTVNSNILSAFRSQYAYALL